ncbi:hypothetical protein BD779DRAFT_1479405 [Infundibulicybe gibba]|nr:hypothetical protein BD779DRAFT_1479405 [Infundibulicybe gibba]
MAVLKTEERPEDRKADGGGGAVTRGIGGADGVRHWESRRRENEWPRFGWKTGLGLVGSGATTQLEKLQDDPAEIFRAIEKNKQRPSPKSPSLEGAKWVIMGPLHKSTSDPEKHWTAGGYSTAGQLFRHAHISAEA